MTLRSTYFTDREAFLKAASLFEVNVDGVL
jgi:hypothetical protein